MYGDLNVLAINRHSTDPLVVAAFHESVHYLKSADIDTYNSIVSDMKEYALNDDEYRNSHAEIVKNIEEKSYSDYMSGDAQKDADFVEEEFTSSALSYLFSDAKNVKKFAQENFNGFQRVVDNVIHVFEKNISMYEGRDKSVRDMYEPIIDKLKAQKKSIIQRYDDGISGTVNDYTGVDKYSIKFDKYGKKYWMIESENDIFKDISNLKELRKAAYDYILHGEKGELVDEIIDGNPLKFVRVGAKEYLYGTASETLNRTNYRQKMRMAPSILDLIENANVSYHTNDHKNHKIARDGFENYRGRVRIDNVIFNYIVRVGNADSKYTFYDINLEVESILPSTEVRQEYNKNDSTSTDIISNPDKNVNEKFSLPQGTIPESSKKQIDRILHRAGNRYGISDLSQDELSGVSLSQKDIDARLGREFAFDNDIRVQSQYRDRFNNSLHLSDSVIFRYGEGADASFGTGRILNFENDGSVGICVDSGETYSNTITLDSKNVFFVAHNNMETVSKDFATSNLAYSSAKEAFDHFGLTGDISRLRKFGFNRAQNYLFSSSNKVNAIYSKLLSMTEKYERYDDGAYDGHSYYNSFNDKNANAFTYDDMSPYGLLTQLYDAVRNYNLSKDISDIFISMGASPVDYDKMSADIKSSDLDYFSIKNGNYYFVDVHRNFERTFGKYYN